MTPIILRRLAASFREDSRNLRPVFEFILELGMNLYQQLFNLAGSPDKAFVDKKLDLLAKVFRLHLGCLMFAPNPLTTQQTLGVPMLMTNRFFTPT